MGMGHISRQERCRKSDSCEPGLNVKQIRMGKTRRESQLRESHQAATARTKLWTLARASWCGSGVVKQNTSVPFEVAPKTTLGFP